MLGLIFVFSLFAWIVAKGLTQPWKGLIGFYGWVILEPEWNWRWSVPTDFGFQKYIAFAVLAGWLLHGFRVNHTNSYARSGTVSLLVFLALAFLSAQQSIAPELSSFYMSNMWKIVTMAILAVLLIDTPKKIYIALLVVVIAQGYNAFRINEQYFQDGYSLFAYRPWGSKGDNNLYSNLTVPLIACSLACSFCYRNRQIKYLCLGIAILQAHQLMLLQSRGAMLAGLVMALLTFMLVPKTTWNRNAILFIVAAASFLAGPSVIEEFSSAFVSKEDRDSSAESRFVLWQAGWDISKDHPLLGVGPYAGQRLVPQYSSTEILAKNKGLHNLFFEVSTGCGIPAALFYSLFFLLPVVYWGSSKRKPSTEDEIANALRIATVAGIPGYLVASMFSSGALSESSYFVAALGLAGTSVYSRQPLIQPSHMLNTQGEITPQETSGEASA